MGPVFGYYPEEKTLIVICLLESKPRLKEIFGKYTPLFTWLCGQLYLSGHTGLKATKTHMVKPMVEGRGQGTKTLLRIALNYPQTAYHGFTSLLQAE